MVYLWHKKGYILVRGVLNFGEEISWRELGNHFSTPNERSLNFLCNFKIEGESVEEVDRFLLFVGTHAAKDGGAETDVGNKHLMKT